MEYILGLAAFVAAVALLFVAVRALARVLFGRSRRLERDLALDVLRSRLSRGEISKAQFEDAARTVGSG